MTPAINVIVQEHHAFYEVAPYYVVLDERPAGQEPITRRIQAGFDVDVLGMSIENHLVAPGADPDYGAGCTELHKIVERVSRSVTSQSVVEVIPFGATALFDLRRHAVEGMIRIRIHHYRGLDQPSGSPEEHALGLIEAELKKLGIRRG
jgi:hypothetical protein